MSTKVPGAKDLIPIVWHFEEVVGMLGSQVIGDLRLKGTLGFLPLLSLPLLLGCHEVNHFSLPHTLHLDTLLCHWSKLTRSNNYGLKTVTP